MRLNKNCMTLRMLQIASNICDEDGHFTLTSLSKEFYKTFPQYKFLFKASLSNRIGDMSYGPKAYLQRTGYGSYKIKAATADYLIQNNLLIFKEPHVI